MVQGYKNPHQNIPLKTAKLQKAGAPALPAPFPVDLHPVGTRSWCEVGQDAAHGMRSRFGTSVGTSPHAGQPWALLGKKMGWRW